MDPSEGVLHVVTGPVVAGADPFEAATADLARPGVLDPFGAEVAADDPLVPPRGSGLAGWGDRFGRALRRCAPALPVVGLFTALPLHFFTGRVDDTVVVAPALFDLAGGVGLLLLPIMWAAYFAVAALPMAIALAGTAAIAIHEAAGRGLPRPAAAWRLVAYRLRPLWAWFAAFGVLTQSLPLLLTADPVGATAVPLALLLGLVATGMLTFVGLLGCVVLVERGSGLRRALHLASQAPLGGLIAASLAATVLPRLADALVGDLLGTAVAVVTVQLWGMAALIAYAQARHVSSAALFAALAAPESD